MHKHTSSLVIFFLFRALGAFSAPWRLSGSWGWDEWFESWIDTWNMVQLCWFSSCAFTCWLPIGWLAYGKIHLSVMAALNTIEICMQCLEWTISNFQGTRLEILTWSMAWNTAGCIPSHVSANNLTPNWSCSRKITGPSPRLNYEMDPVGKQCTSRHCITPWLAWPRWDSGTSQRKRTTRKSFPFAWWSWPVRLKADVLCVVFSRSSRCQLHSFSLLF